MKYMLLIHSGAVDEQGGAPQCTVEDWMAYDKDVRDAGILVSGESLADLVTATTVRVSPTGERTVTDGPFAETREPEEARVAVEAVFREERGLLLASLVRRFGDLDLAEEVTSEAIEAALRHWPAEGVPARPGAWLLTTARRKAVDRLRRDRAYAARLAVLQADAERAKDVAAPTGHGELPDERLQLFYTCAHPALAAEDRTALTLHCLAGLTTPEVARAFLVPRATMAQRIVRAKGGAGRTRGRLSRGSPGGAGPATGRQGRPARGGVLGSSRGPGDGGAGRGWRESTYGRREGSWPEPQS